MERVKRTRRRKAKLEPFIHGGDTGSDDDVGDSVSDFALFELMMTKSGG